MKVKTTRTKRQDKIGKGVENGAAWVVIGYKGTSTVFIEHQEEEGG